MDKNSPECHKGILRSYYIQYTGTVLAGEVVSSYKRLVKSKKLRGNRYGTVLTDLDLGSSYDVQMFG